MDCFHNVIRVVVFGMLLAPLAGCAEPPRFRTIVPNEGSSLIRTERIEGTGNISLGHKIVDYPIYDISYTVYSEEFAMHLGHDPAFVDPSISPAVQLFQFEWKTVG